MRCRKKYNQLRISPEDMPASCPNKFKQMGTSELLEQFPRYHSKLDEYVHSAKIMDEQTFRRTYENDQGTLPFSVIQVPDICLSLYRSRLARFVSEDEDLSAPQTFSYVPLASTNANFPKLQRANFSGQSVFYGSLSSTTNFREISEDVTAGEEIYMAKWNFSPDANLMLYKVLPPKDTFLNEYLRKMLGMDEETSDAFESFFQKLGEILKSTEEGNAKYLVSALCANFVYKFHSIILPDGSKIKPFDGILYPSTKVKEGNEWNMAIKPECIDQYATLQYVVRGKVAKDLCSIDYSDIGFYKDGEIHWYGPWIDQKDITPTKIFVWGTNNCLVDLDGGILYDKVGKVVSNPWEVFEYQKDQWAGEYIRHFQSSLRIDCNLEELEEEHLPTATFLGYPILRDVDGWKLVRNDREYDIGKIGFEFQVKSTFRRTQKPNGIN